MPVHNADIAAIFDEIADLLESRARIRSAYDELREVLAHGASRASVRLKSGLQVDMRLVEERNYGAALQYFTGSKTYSIALRRIAQELGLKLNEYGIFRNDRCIAGETEESVYATLGLGTSIRSCARIAARSKRRALRGCRSLSRSVI